MVEDQGTLALSMTQGLLYHVISVLFVEDLNGLEFLWLHVRGAFGYVVQRFMLVLVLRFQMFVTYPCHDGCACHF